MGSNIGSALTVFKVSWLLGFGNVLEGFMVMVSAIALDVGSKRIGVAGCDGTGLIATGLFTLDRTSFEADMDILRQVIAERQATILIVGLPYTLDGEVGKQAKRVQKFANRLHRALGLPLEYVDERLTSIAAEEMMIAAGRSLRENKGEIDRRAAAIILQQWLDLRRQRS
jgi:putative holliday junction resolvase